MEKRYVITNVPTRLPIQSTILYSFLLYHFDVDRIWWGIFITVFTLVWITAIYLIFKEEKVDMFKGLTTEGLNSVGIKSRWSKRLEEAIKAREDAKK